MVNIHSFQHCLVFVSEESRTQDITVNHKVGRVIKGKEKSSMFILWPCFKTENRNVKICAKKKLSAFTGDSFKRTQELIFCLHRQCCDKVLE